MSAIMNVRTSSDPSQCSPCLGGDTSLAKVIANPKPREEIRIRVASDADDTDFKFIDELHKKHTHGLGFWHAVRIRTHIARKEILIAESPAECVPDGKAVPGINGSPLGFIIATDKYKSREDVACIYAVCVKEMKRRSLVAAALVQAVFESFPYGVKLCCCWCAQDLDAGYFWESIGFVPLAFRTGSEKKQRVHIFWQKRIRTGDMETPWWYPSKTHGGAIREGRLVLPIPPGVHWKDEKPMVLPEVPGVNTFKQLEAEVGAEAAVDIAAVEEEKKREREQRKQRRKDMKLTKKQERASLNGGFFIPTLEQRAAAEELAAAANEKKLKKQKKSAKEVKQKEKREYSEEFLEKARDLCAVWLERLQGPDGDHLLATDAAKYDVTRSLECGPPVSHRALSNGAAHAAAPGRMLIAAESNCDDVSYDDEDDLCDIIDAEYTITKNTGNSDENASRVHGRVF
ncbi:MAG: hypothetical protein ACR2GY_01240 [Phycisphaerales bacterium]